MKRKRLLTLLPIILLTTFVACGSTEEKLPDTESIVESIVATEKSNIIENPYLLSTSEDFYKLIASNLIDQKYEADSGEATLETVQRAYEACDVWNQQIDYTGAHLKSLLNDSECDKLQNVIDLWKDYYQEKVSIYQSLFGISGIIPGSLYKQISADILVEENRLMAFALLSLEYELSQDIQFVIENEEDKANSESISRYDFSEENVCIEYCEDFEVMLDSYSLDEKNSEELELLISQTADMIQEKIGDDNDFVSNVNKYVSIINTLNEIEEQVAADDRYITVKEERLRLYATQLLNIEYMVEEYSF